jgi:hypothetical protein
MGSALFYVIVTVILGVPLGLMTLAWFTDHESAASAGCIEEGQVW